MKKFLNGEKFEEEIKQVLAELCEQLYILHVVKGSAHNDIKPENILFRDNKYVLHDLGLASQVTQNTAEITDLAGTLLYMSPQKLNHYSYCQG